MNKLGLRTGVVGGIGLSALLCAFVACGDDATAGGSGNNADGGSNTPGTPGSDPNAPPGTPGGPLKSGTVTIGETSFTILSTTTVTASASAQFIDLTGKTGTSDGGSASASCTNTTDGDCAITACESSGGGGVPEGGAASDAGPTKFPNAGEIKVTGATELTLTPNSTSGYYTPQTAQTALYTDGEDVTIDAKGAEVPAFNTKITPPPDITLSAPVLPATPGTPFAIDRSQDMTVTWSNGAGDGTVSLSLIGTKQESGTTHSTIVICKFATSGGTGKVTAATLGKLPAGGSGTYGFSQTNTKTIDAADWKVSINATRPPQTDNNASTSGLASFQ